MKIDDLVANLEKNAQEQDKIMTEKMQSVTTQHLASYNEQLKSSLKVTQSIIKDHQSSLQKDLSRLKINKITTGIVLGIMVSCLIVLVIANLWLYKKYQSQKEQLAQIQQHIEQTPLEAKILSKVKVGEADGKYYIISSHKKAETYKSTKDNQVLTFPTK